MSESERDDRLEPPSDALPEAWNDWDDWDEGASEAWEELAESDLDEPEPDWDDFDLDGDEY